MKKNNKILIASLSAAGLVGLSLGISLPLLLQTEESKVIFNTPETTISLGEEEISNLERVAEGYLFSTNEAVKLEGETPETPEETPETPEETPEEAPDGGEGVDSVTQLTADWVQIGFFNTALTGNWDITPLSTPADYTPESILVAQDQDWNVAGLTGNTTDFNTVYNHFVEAKIYNETTNAGKDLYVWLSEVSQYNFEVAKAAEVFIHPTIDNIWTAEAQDEAAWDNLVNVLGDTLEFRKELTPLVYTYTYLWQDSNSNGVYDYMLTEILVDNKAAFTWTFNVNNIGKEIDSDQYDDGTVLNDQTFWNNEVSSAGTDQLSAGSNASGDESKESKDNWLGFDGIQFSNSSTHQDEDIWNYSEHFSYNQDGTSNRETDNLSVQVAQDEDTTDFIITEPGSETGKVVRYKTVMPYTFATGYDSVEETADAYTYSLFATEDADGLPSTVTTANREDAGAVNIFQDSVGIVADDEQGTEAWITYYMMTADATIMDDAFAFWKDKGFSIELTGEYEDTYGELIHQGIQR